MTLKEWLQSEEKDYGIGLALLGKYSKNRILLQNLSRKQNPAKVEYELKKAAKLLKIDLTKVDDSKDVIENKGESGNKSSKVESHSDQVIDKMNGAPQEIAGTSRAHGTNISKMVVIRENHEVKYDDLPKEIQVLWDANRDAYKEIRATHEKLKLMEKAAPEDRVPLLARIDELDISIRTNWDVIDAWEPDAEVPTKKEEDSAAIDHKRINANRKYLSTNSKKLAAETNQVKADKLRIKIQERVVELKTAEAELNPKTVEELTKLGIEC